MNGMWCELDSTEYGVNYVHGSMLSSRSLRRHAARSSCFSASWLPRILWVSPQFGQWRLAFKDFNRDIGGTTFYWPKILIRMLYTVWLCKPCACIYIYYVYIYIYIMYISSVVKTCIKILRNAISTVGVPHAMVETPKKDLRQVDDLQTQEQ